MSKQTGANCHGCGSPVSIVISPATEMGGPDAHAERVGIELGRGVYCARQIVIAYDGQDRSSENIFYARERVPGCAMGVAELGERTFVGIVEASLLGQAERVLNDRRKQPVDAPVPEQIFQY